jgi:phosphoglucosamine mutase
MLVIKKLFGTDGIRGIANEVLTPELAFRVGQALTVVYKNKIDKVMVLVGKDTRASSDMLEASFCSGVTSAGGEIIKVGIMPSAGVCYLAKQLKCHAGVVITASHNQPEFNGIKIFNGNGYKLTRTQELQIEQIVAKNETLRAKNEIIGGIIFNDQAKNAYENYLTKNSPILQGVELCIDCANGAGYSIFPNVLKKLGAKVEVINNSKNGLLINKNCGATDLKSLVEKVKLRKFDASFALDGDADRLMCVDGNGKIIDGDAILFLIAKYLKQKNRLNKNTVVGTIMTGFGTELALKRIGIKLVRVRVGDKYVIEQMVKENLDFGGEASGHFIFKNNVTTADGILTALELIKIMKNTGKNLTELTQEIKKIPQVKFNVFIEENKKELVLDNAKVKEEIKSAKETLENFGRVVIRASGTENVIRIMVEGKNEKLINNVAKKLKKVVKSV